MSNSEQTSRPSIAEVYEQFLVPAIFAPWAQELLTRAEVRPGERVLDIGCGTGIVSRTAAQVIGEKGDVIALDTNPLMLAVARSIVPAHSSAPIEWIEGTAESIPLPDSSRDLVTFQQVLQFVPDRAAALIEAHRVLAPSGRVAVSVFAAIELHPAHIEFDRVFASHLGRSALRPGFALGNPTALRELLEAAGFTVRSLDLITKESRFQDPDNFARPYILSSSAGIPSFRQMDVAARDELVTAIERDLLPIVRSLTIDGVVILPWHAYIAIASV